MLEGIKDFEKEANEITKKENMKINELHKDIVTGIKLIVKVEN